MGRSFPCRCCARAVRRRSVAGSRPHRCSACSGSSIPARATARWFAPQRPCVAPEPRRGCASSVTPRQVTPRRWRSWCAAAGRGACPWRSPAVSPRPTWAARCAGSAYRWLPTARLGVRERQLVDRSGAPPAGARRGVRPRDARAPTRHDHPLRRRDAGPAPRGRAAPAGHDVDRVRDRPGAEAQGHRRRPSRVVGVGGPMTAPPYGTSVPGNR